MRREKIATCMTCPICNNLLSDATTISECLHTFCRECIFEKITEEDLDCCPVCNINLGIAPLDKLRADHSLQDLRARLFPSKKTKVKAVEVAPSVPLATRRKERSLSSLVVNTPRIPEHTAATGKGTKSGERKAIASQDLTFPVEEPIKPVEDHAGCSSSPETINKITQNIIKEAKGSGNAAKHTSKRQKINPPKAPGIKIKEGVEKTTKHAKAVHGEGRATLTDSEAHRMLTRLMDIDPSYQEPWVVEMKRNNGQPILRCDSLHDDPEGCLAVARAFLTPFDVAAADLMDFDQASDTALVKAVENLIAAITLTKVLARTQAELAMAVKAKEEASYYQARCQDLEKNVREAQQKAMDLGSKLCSAEGELERAKAAHKLKVAALEADLQKRQQTYEKDRARLKSRIKKIDAFYPPQVSIIGCQGYRAGFEERDKPPAEQFHPDLCDAGYGLEPGQYPLEVLELSDSEDEEVAATEVVEPEKEQPKAQTPIDLGVSRQTTVDIFCQSLMYE